MKLYEYTKSPLNPKVEEREDLNPVYPFRKGLFRSGLCGGQDGRLSFIPKEGKRPFQTVIHWPGGMRLQLKSISEITAAKDNFDHLTKTGRAVVLPILRGTFDRKFTPEIKAKTTAQERRAMQVKDFMRTMDYLETRPEFDTKKLAYEGRELGGGNGIHHSRHRTEDQGRRPDRSGYSTMGIRRITIRSITRPGSPRPS